jgi:hypothetical protein
MTRTISLIIGIATAALVVAVPTAFGEGRIGSLQVQSDTTYVDANERGALVNSTQPTVGAYTDAHERGTLQPSGVESLQSTYVDANERVGVTPISSPEPSIYRDGGERGTIPAGTVAVVATGSGSEIDWPQVGIGFGVGILLALGLLLAMRFTRIRPLAH